MYTQHCVLHVKTLGASGKSITPGNPGQKHANEYNQNLILPLIFFKATIGLAARNILLFTFDIKLQSVDVSTAITNSSCNSCVGEQSSDGFADIEMSLYTS